MKLEEIEAALNLKENRDKKVVLKAVHNLVKALEKGGRVQGRVQGRLHKISLSGGYGFEELESGLGHLFRDKFYSGRKDAQVPGEISKKGWCSPINYFPAPQIYIPPRLLHRVRPSRIYGSL